MKTIIQLALKEEIEKLSWRGNKLFDSVVVNRGNTEEEDDPDNKLMGNSGCIISLQDLNFTGESLKDRRLETEGTGFIASIHKLKDPNAEELYEKAPILIAKMMWQNRTLGGLVAKVRPMKISWNLFTSDTIGFFFMSEMTFGVDSRFFVEKEEAN